MESVKELQPFLEFNSIYKIRNYIVFFSGLHLGFQWIPMIKKMHFDSYQKGDVLVLLRWWIWTEQWSKEEEDLFNFDGLSNVFNLGRQRISYWMLGNIDPGGGYFQNIYENGFHLQYFSSRGQATNQQPDLRFVKKFTQPKISG